MPQNNLTPNEAQLIQESINSDTKTVNIRLRQGEYQYDLAKEIASFQLDLKFPNAKDIIKNLYGEGKTDERRFLGKIQTILKKMEKNNIIKILPKNKPWELQRYALSSFKFQDIDKTLVTLATPQQIEETQNRLHSTLNPQNTLTTKPSYIKTKLGTLAFIIGTSYTAALWALTQPIINPIIFVPTFYIAVTGSLILGKILAELLSQK